MTEYYLPCLAYFPVLLACSQAELFSFCSFASFLEYLMVNFRISYFKNSHFNWAFGIKFWLL